MALPKIRRSVIVGLGGTGAHTVLNIKKKLYQFYNDIPLCVKFLVLDTDSRLPQELRVSIKGGEEWKIAEIKKEFFYLPVSDPSFLIENSAHIQGWWPEELRSIGAITNGTGQFRARGRLAFHAHANAIKNAFSRLVEEVTDQKLDEQMRNNQELEIVGGVGVNVYIIGSIAGGTGSGSFIDAGFLFKRSLPGAENKISAFLFMPWIFRGLPATHRIGPNAYAALKELDYYMNLDYMRQQPRLIFGDEEFNADRPPFDVITLVEGKNESGLHVRGHGFSGMKNLCEIVGMGIALNIGTVGQQAESALDNLYDYTRAQDKRDWDGKKPNYSSFGVSSIVYPVEKHYNKFYSYYAFCLIDNVLKNMDKQTAPDLEVERDVNSFCTDNRLDERNNNIMDDIFDPGQMPTLQLPPGIESAQALKDFVSRSMQATMEDVRRKMEQNLLEKKIRAIQALKSSLNERTLNYGPAYSIKLAEKLSARMESYHNDRSEDIQDRERHIKETEQNMNSFFNNEVQNIGFRSVIFRQKQKIFETYLGFGNTALQEQMEVERRRKALEVYKELAETARGYIKNLNLTDLEKNLSRVKEEIESDLFTTSFIIPHYGEYVIIESKSSILIKGKEKKQKKEIMFTPKDFEEIGIPVDVKDFMENMSIGFKDMAEMDSKEFKDKLLAYAKKRTAIIKNITIEDVLLFDVKSDSDVEKNERLKYHLEEASRRATPLWHHKAMADKAARIEEIFLIGIENAEGTRLAKMDYSSKRYPPTFTNIHDPYKLFFFKFKAPLPAHLLVSMKDYWREYLDVSLGYTPHAEKDIELEAPDLFPKTAEDVLISKIYTLSSALYLIKKDINGLFYIDDQRCLELNTERIDLGRAYWSTFEELKENRKKSLRNALLDILKREIQRSPEDVVTALNRYLNEVKGLLASSKETPEKFTVGDKILLHEQLELVGGFLKKDGKIENFIPS